MRFAQPSILIEVTIMLDDYFMKNPGVKDLPWPGIKPQSPSLQPVVSYCAEKNQLF